ncbi:hypothetical protein ABTL10_19485, partial [Acinetobacter baumannii]
MTAGTAFCAGIAQHAAERMTSGRPGAHTPLLNPMQLETLTISLQDHIATVRLNRPDKANAMNATMWQEIRLAFDWI